MASSFHKVPKMKMNTTLSSILMIKVFLVAHQALASQAPRRQLTTHYRQPLTSAPTRRICVEDTGHYIM